MCTAATYSGKDHYFGRNLDLEFSYHETVTITPRSKAFPFRHVPAMANHFAIIGMSYVVDDFPLYYDAMNEKGLGMAGLNFPDNACYGRPQDGKDNIASFEFIPYVLGQCQNITEAKAFLSRIHITDDAFAPQLPPSPLHWMLADKDSVITVEQTNKGLTVYDNPVGVMTNNPTFDYQMTHLADYMNASAGLPGQNLIPGVTLNTYSRGMGGMGIPGDLSSASRFVKAAFTKMNAEPADTDSASITQFFKILGSVEQQKGCCRLGKDKDGKDICEYTIYSSCCDLDTGIYYYTTYENSQINGVDMHHADLDGSALSIYELIKGQHISMQN